MEDVHVVRLKTLADALDRMPEEQFDLTDWKCGTTCCAVGLACTIPEFQAAGLTLQFGPEYDEFYPVFRNSVGFEAAERFFGLTAAQAKHLFGKGSYYNLPLEANPSDVARRIRALLADHGLVAGAGV